MVLLIKNGCIYDAEKNCMVDSDVYIKDGSITDPGIEQTVDEVMDAAGCYVVPALVDAHAHVNRQNHGFGANADQLCIPNGVLSMVDAGSLGIHGVEAFIKNEICNYHVDVKTLVNAASEGQGLDFAECLSADLIESDKIIALFRQYRNHVCGIKLRYEKETVQGGGLAPLKKCIQISDQLQREGFKCPLVVHLGDLGETVALEDLLGLLRAGDVLAHVFQGRGQTILKPDGRIKICVWEAKQRGVLFDLAHGRTCFRFPSMEEAIKQGFSPDLLGTDIHGGSLYKLPAHSMMCTATMMYHMGMKLVDIFKALTYTAAETFGFQDKVTMFHPGSPADLSIIRVLPKEIELSDAAGNVIRPQCVFHTEAVIQNGTILYRHM